MKFNATDKGWRGVWLCCCFASFMISPQAGAITFLCGVASIVIFEWIAWMYKEMKP